MGRRPGQSAPEGQLRQGGRSLLLALYTALRSLKMYPVENATVQKALDDLDVSARALLQPRRSWRSGRRATSSSSTRRACGSSSTTTPHSATSWRCSGHSTSASCTSGPGWSGASGRSSSASLLSLSQQGETEERLEVLQERLEGAKVTHLELERAPAGGRKLSEEIRHQAKRVYSEGVAVTRDMIAGVRLGPGPSPQAGEASGPAGGRPGAQQRNVHGGHDHGARLRRVHLHSLGQRLHLLRGLGQEAGILQGPALRSRV